jgi:hypothetical protein
MGTYPYCSGNVSRICDVDLWSCDLQNRELDLGNCVCVCVCVCMRAVCVFFPLLLHVAVCEYHKNYALNASVLRVN